MRFQLIVASNEDGYRWVSRDVEKEYDLSKGEGCSALGTAVADMILNSKERAASRQPYVPEHCRCHTDHDCFAEENEVMTMQGQRVYTHCRVCKMPISAG